MSDVKFTAAPKAQSICAFMYSLGALNSAVTMFLLNVVQAGGMYQEVRYWSTLQKPGPSTRMGGCLWQLSQ